MLTVIAVCSESWVPATFLLLSAAHYPYQNPQNQKFIEIMSGALTGQDTTLLSDELISFIILIEVFYYLYYNTICLLTYTA